MTGTVHNGSNRDWFTAKYDVSGTRQWLRIFDFVGPYGTGHDDGHHIGLDNAGRVYVEGMPGGGCCGAAEDYGIIIYDTNGSQLCSDRYDGPGPSESRNDISSDIAVIPGGGAYVTGSSINPSNFDLTTVRWNTSCGKDWVRRYDAGENENGGIAVADAVGGVYVSGRIGPSGGPPPASGIITLHYDAAGNQTGPALYQGPAGGEDRPQGIAISDTGVYVSGASDFIGSGGGPDAAMVVVAYSHGLNQRWVERQPAAVGPGLHVDVHLGDIGGIYVAGGGTPYVIKYCEDRENDGLSDCYESLHLCLDPFASDADGDADSDGLDNATEYGLGTDPCVNDTDGDGCADGEEVGDNENLGGQRDPLNAWDFFDVPLPVGEPGAGTRDKQVDGNDVMGVLAKFGASPGDPIPTAPKYDAAYDRSEPSPDPWDTQAPDGVQDGNDVIWNLWQFGHSCFAPP